MIHAAQIAAEPPRNPNNRQRFIRSPRQRDAATERFGWDGQEFASIVTSLGESCGQE